ncbi:MAG: DNA-processing protein DprA, partial [Gammaproteobacteria bacterium]|nr:DNA-processing protein DprA [Gammaproteobacteria bacterium]
MNNLLTDDTKAILLLCGVFGNDRQINPLTQTQYNRLARWLNSERMRPNDLLEQENIDTAATGAEIDAEQLRGLLGRGVQLGFAVEEWQRNGIWVIGRSDRDYPERYKRHLKTQSPPLIFGIGNRALLHGGGLAVVGSRDADDADGAFFTRKTARSCVHGGMPVIFGGAGDIDG